MVLAARLEIHSLELPSHRPVHFPDELSVERSVRKRHAMVVTTARTVVLDGVFRFAVRGDDGRVAIARRTIRTEWVVRFAPHIHILGVTPRCLECGEDIEDLEALLQSYAD